MPWWYVMLYNRGDIGYEYKNKFQNQLPHAVAVEASYNRLCLEGV